MRRERQTAETATRDYGIEFAHDQSPVTRRAASKGLRITFEFLPGRQMVPFVTGGVGASIMQGRTEASFNFGAGTTLFLSRRSGMRWEARDYVFHSGTDNARRLHHNIEFSIGTLMLF